MLDVKIRHVTAGTSRARDSRRASRRRGSVLELACGPGVWTPQLLRHASDVTAVDASPEMLAIAASRVPGGAPVRFVEADLFTWEPDRQYGLVFMGFWLSHEPADLERQLRALGWDITVTPTAGPFFWGAGSRMAVT